MSETNNKAYLVRTEEAFNKYTNQGRYCVMIDKVKEEAENLKDCIVRFKPKNIEEKVKIYNLLKETAAAICIPLNAKEEHDLKKDFIYPYVDTIKTKKETKYIPLKIWENLEALLKFKGIEIKYNILSKEIESTVKADGENVLISDIHSIANKNRLKLTEGQVQSFIYRIARKNKYNPVQDYLENCYNNWDNQSRLKELFNTIEVDDWFKNEHKERFIEKWLINAVRIAFNEGSYNTEGVLVFQGDQGIGKTRWIKSIVPSLNWVKTGIEVDPSDKDKVKLATKYWITELGEMDSTLKREQGKLKAFFTESKDEYRLPYARAEECYPRQTIFYATVNDEEFLKDTTGNRRYWVLPVVKINVNHKIDLDQLWGEVMYLWKDEQKEHYLTKADMEILNDNNKGFEVKDPIYIKVDNAFDWEAPTEKWSNMKATEIAAILGINNPTILGTRLKEFGALKKRTSKCIVWTVPPLKDVSTSTQYVLVENHNKNEIPFVK